MNNKKILMITQGLFPPDIRLEKEIRSLTQHGYKITIVCNQYDKNKNPEFEFCEIQRIRAISNNYKINKILNFPFFLNPRYLASVYKAIVRFKPNYLHAHDLPMVPLALLFGKIFRLPVIFDMHENYPDALKEFDKKGILSFIFKNPEAAKLLEKICIKSVDKIIVVIEESKERLIKLGVPSEKVYVVSNTVDTETFYPNLDSSPKFFAVIDNRPLVIYTGTVSADRGLITPIKAAEYFDKMNLDVQILIVGEGDRKKYLIEYVKQHKLDYYVKFMNWPGHDLIPNLIDKADVCMIPQPANNFINTTIPHKLFEYMFMQKPVLAADSIPMKRILNETNAGLCFRSNDPADFVQKLFDILKKKYDFGAAGKSAVAAKYNWANDAKVLLNLYKSLN